MILVDIQKKQTKQNKTKCANVQMCKYTNICSIYILHMSESLKSLTPAVYGGRRRSNRKSNGGKSKKNVTMKRCAKKVKKDKKNKK